MKKNITLKLDASIIHEARIIAAKKGKSVSALLAEQLEKVVRDRTGYEEARERDMKRMREGRDLGWTPPKSRDELHER